MQSMLPFSESAPFKMDWIQIGTLFIVLITIRFTKGAVPGTFFWKPRMAIDLSLPRTEHPLPVPYPNRHNIINEYVVLIEGYQAGITIVAIIIALDDAKPHPHLDVRRASYYTNMYRWGLRYLDMLKYWLGGSGGTYADTHKVWRRRFFYMDSLPPKWMRKLVPYVTQEDWEKEEFDLRRFNKYAEPAFGKHYHYPKKVYVHNFQSEITYETIENMNRSDLSIKGP